MKIKMKCITCNILLFLAINSSKAQYLTTKCRVLLPNIKETYTGDCKKGLAEGKGEAKGLHKYIGEFKDGMPNGIGTYYFSDSIFFMGAFQNGIKEGKGEHHYVKSNSQDSIVKGYWSGDVFQGSEYTTYKFNSITPFESKDIRASKTIGNRITINITKGNSGHISFTSEPSPIIAISSLIPDNPLLHIDKTSDYTTPTKYSGTYEVSGFPIRLYGTFSNGETFEIELFKAANWNINLFQSM